jgi:hypothetical protein
MKIYYDDRTALLYLRSHHLDLSGVLPIQYQRPIYQERERVEAAASQMVR